MKAAITSAALVIAWCATACPGATVAPVTGPEAIVSAYRDALVEGRPDDAFALLHADAREGMDRDRFRVYYDRHRDALIAQAEGLVARAATGAPEERAWVATDRGVVELLRTPEGWRLTRPVGGDATPSAAGRGADPTSEARGDAAATPDPRERGGPEATDAPEPDGAAPGARD